MTANRVSTELSRFFGAQLTAQYRGGKLANVFQAGRGGEQTIPAGVRRVTGSDLVPASINTADYEVAVAFLSRTSAQPNTIPALAVAFLDVSKRLGITVSELLSATDDQQIRLLELRAFTFLNQLRDPTSRIGRVVDSDPETSLIARQLRPFDPGERIPVFDWGSQCFEQIVDPPTVEPVIGRRVAFSPDEQWFATRSGDSTRPIVLFNTQTWDQNITLGLGMSTNLITALEFNPRNSLLVIGGFTPDASRGLRIININTFQRVPGSPSYGFVNWAAWSPDGERLAVIHSEDNTFATSRLTVLNRQNWQVEHEIINNIPLRPLSGAWSPNGESLAIYGNVGSISRLLVLRTRDWFTLRNVNTPGGNVAYGSLGPTFAFLPDNRNIVIPPNSEFRPSDVYVYDWLANSGSLQPIPLGLAFSARVTPDERYLVVSGTAEDITTPSATVVILDLETWDIVHEQAFPDVEQVVDVAISPTGRWMALANFTPPPRPAQRPLIYTPC